MKIAISSWQRSIPRFRHPQSSVLHVPTYMGYSVAAWLAGVTTDSVMHSKNGRGQARSIDQTAESSMMQVISRIPSDVVDKSSTRNIIAPVASAEI